MRKSGRRKKEEEKERKSGEEGQMDGRKGVCPLPFCIEVV